MNTDAPAPRLLGLVWHPARRRSGRVRREVVRQARAAGWAVQVLPTTEADAGAAQAGQALASGAELVIAAGGDGTIREVAAVLAGSGVPLGVVPGGTANLFARNLGLRPHRLRACVRTALGGVPTTVDLGRLDLTTADGAEHAGLPFLVLAGIGHDAATVAATHPDVKHRLGWPAYLSAGVRHLFRRAVPMTIRLDDRPERDVRVWAILAGNCGRIPGGIPVFPGARWDDGVLEALEVPLSSPFAWLGVAAKGLLRLRRDVAALRYDRAHQVTVRPATPQPAQLDGDVVSDVTRWTARLEPGAVVVHRPATRGTRKP